MKGRIQKGKKCCDLSVKRMGHAAGLDKQNKILFA